MPSYALHGKPTESLKRFVDDVAAELEAQGFERAELADADIVLNLIDHDAPTPFRRHSRGTFAAALHERERAPQLVDEYPLLVRALANIVCCHVPGEGVWFTTMEQGHFLVAGGAKEFVEKLLPPATARLVIDNEFRTDLEPELWGGDEVTEELQEAGRRLDELGLLPSPFPLEEVLGERELRHVKRLYGIGGLSYGNLSMRKDARRFWMSASGVDKSKLEEPGRDILLVSDYDEANGRIVLSVPPGVTPRRVSVDAIEHWMIYQQNPDVGAILHVHAWVDGIESTQLVFPCGSEELACAVAELVRRSPDPSEAIAGLRNHGITATGPGLLDILDRIESRVQRQVPMTA
ncbi:MAG TPA: class II aldolase/adducin family protein [Gaiellaceae bacterium]|nr:class II aldolase/adducin family protein [Gaiellaceae bacterium]